MSDNTPSLSQSQDDSPELSGARDLAQLERIKQLYAEGRNEEADALLMDMVITDDPQSFYALRVQLAYAVQETREAVHSALPRWLRRLLRTED